MTLLSASVSAGYSFAGLAGAGRVDSFARYAASRSVALPLAVLLATTLRSRTGILFMGAAMTIMQLLDGIIGLQAYDPAKIFGPFLFALINAILVIWLVRRDDDASQA
jgi:hypothetical protein